jgi:carbonic anhydrase
MEKLRELVHGLRSFRTTYYPSHRELFEEFAKGQHPQVMFVTCSDSRIDPNLMTQMQMGELFVLRNAGNIVPPYGAANGGEGATIEYGISALGIDKIIICGHTHCGAMKGLLKLNQLQEKMPLVYNWLGHAESTRRLVLENYVDYDPEDLAEIMVAENVLAQINNLKTYPVIHSRLFQGRIKIFGWIYNIETGGVLQISLLDHEPAYLPECPVRLSDATDMHIPGRCVMPLTEVTEASPAPIESSNGTPQRSPASTSTEPPVDAGWLPSEQRERIYRGSSRR